MEAETLSTTLAEVTTEVLIDALGDWVKEVEAETLSCTLEHVDPAHTLDVVEVKKLDVTLGDVKA